MKIDGAVSGRAAVPVSVYRSRVTENRRGQIAHWCVEVHAIEQVARCNSKSKGIFTIARTEGLVVMWAMSWAARALHILADWLGGSNMCPETK